MSDRQGPSLIEWGRTVATAAARELAETGPLRPAVVEGLENLAASLRHSGLEEGIEVARELERLAANPTVTVTLTLAQANALRTAVEIAGADVEPDDDRAQIVASMWSADVVLRGALDA